MFFKNSGIIRHTLETPSVCWTASRKLLVTKVHIPYAAAQKQLLGVTRHLSVRGCVCMCMCERGVGGSWGKKLLSVHGMAVEK